MKTYSTSLTVAKAVATDNAGFLYVGDAGLIQKYDIATDTYEVNQSGA